jgi:hypothetical protein
MAKRRRPRVKRAGIWREIRLEWTPRKTMKKHSDSRTWSGR